MAYKDKDRQREAVKAATQRYRAKKGDSVLSSQKQGLKNARGLPVVDEVGDTRPVIPSCDTLNVIPKGVTITKAESHVDASDIDAVKTLHRLVQAKKRSLTKAYKQAEKVKAVKALPDKLTDAMLSGDLADEILGKRGKDIKVFEDLPPDVQVIINSMSEVDGKIDQKGKADRTEAAIMYQHHFPDRYYGAK